LASYFVHHFGPDVDTVGGMATVLRVIRDNGVGSSHLQVHSTWDPSSRIRTARLAVRAICAVARLPKDAVVHVHLSERGSFIREGALLGLARWRGLATVATLHGADFISFANRRTRLVSTVLSRADGISCLAPDVCALVEGLVPHATCVMIPNPSAVDLSVGDVRETSQLVLFAGEVGLRKGVDVLCDAWPTVVGACPDAQCMIVGPATTFVPPNLERLEVRPAASLEIIQELIKQARCVTLPSRAEGMPMILTEAMCAGRPFVSTPVGGIQELAEFGGILVPVGDPERLAQALIELLIKPEYAWELGRQGREFSKRTRAPEVVGQQFRELYDAVCDKN
jgi:glycosyltransferase involved in cell wall biosynthesis